jgi:hypothetical protein
LRLSISSSIDRGPGERQNEIVGWLGFLIAKEAVGKLAIAEVRIVREQLRGKIGIAGRFEKLPIANQSEMMSEFCILSIRECGVTLKRRLRILSRRAEKRRSAHSQMEENAHGECPGQWTGANIRGRSLNAAHVVLAR